MTAATTMSRVRQRVSGPGGERRPATWLSSDPNLRSTQDAAPDHGDGVTSRRACFLRRYEPDQVPRVCGACHTLSARGAPRRRCSVVARPSATLRSQAMTRPGRPDPQARCEARDAAPGRSSARHSGGSPASPMLPAERAGRRGRAGRASELPGPMIAADPACSARASAPNRAVLAVAHAGSAATFSATRGSRERVLRRSRSESPGWVRPGRAPVREPSSTSPGSSRGRAP